MHSIAAITRAAGPDARSRSVDPRRCTLVDHDRDPAGVAARPARLLPRTALSPVAALCLALLSGCGGGDDGGTQPPPGDTTAPAAVTDLSLVIASGTTLTVAWTAPGDDGASGQATAYELRYAAAPIDADSWDAATPVAIAAPLAAGAREVATVGGLATSTTYHFAVRAVDEAGNRSALAADFSAGTNALPAWRVALDGSGDATRIEDAMALAAGTGGIVLVAPGRYTWTNQTPSDGEGRGMIFFDGSIGDLALVAEAGPEQTVLDAESQGRVMFFLRYNDGTIIDGFTFTGGNSWSGDSAYGTGGGISAHLTSPTIRNCVFTGNRAVYGGGISYLSTGDPVIENCSFHDNHADSLGGGIYLLNDYLGLITIRDCDIRDNDAGWIGGGIYLNNVSFTIRDCVISFNRASDRGGGIGTSQLPAATTTGEIVGCTLVRNSAPYGGGVRAENQSEWTLSRCLIAYSPAGGGIWSDENSALSVGCTVMYNNVGRNQNNLPATAIDDGGNVIADPRLCSLDDRDLHLQGDSPCLPGNHPEGASCGLVGALPAGCQ